MKPRKFLAAAVGLSLSIGLLAPNLFAFGSEWWETVDPPARTARAPGGALAADAMAAGAIAPGAFPLDLSHRSIDSVEKARRQQNQVGRDIAKARAEGKDVESAEIYDELGNTALRYGDENSAVSYYNRAEEQVRRTNVR
jgi:hypothetical protein